MAQTIVETVRHLSIAPLVTIQHPEFAMQYEQGLAHYLLETHEQHSPLHDLYLVDTFMHVRIALHSFDIQNQ